jgi:hypothetical protein
LHICTLEDDASSRGRRPVRRKSTTRKPRKQSSALKEPQGQKCPHWGLVVGDAGRRPWRSPSRSITLSSKPKRTFDFLVLSLIDLHIFCRTKSLIRWSSGRVRAKAGSDWVEDPRPNQRFWRKSPPCQRTSAHRRSCLHRHITVDICATLICNNPM